MRFTSRTFLTLFALLITTQSFAQSWLMPRLAGRAQDFYLDLRETPDAKAATAMNPLNEIPLVQTAFFNVAGSASYEVSYGDYLQIIRFLYGVAKEKSPAFVRAPWPPMTQAAFDAQLKLTKKSFEDQRAAIQVPKCSFNFGQMLEYANGADKPPTGIRNSRGVIQTSLNFFNLGGIEHSLNYAPYDHNHIFNFIATTESGRKLLSEFLPLYREGKIKIADLTKEIRNERHVAPEIVAVYTLDTHTIYIAGYADLGILSTSLVHEMAHSVFDLGNRYYERVVQLEKALDTLRAQVLLNRSLSPAYTYASLEREFGAAAAYQANVITFLSERNAYTRESDFREELFKIDSCVRPYLEAQSKKNGEHIQDPSDEWIIATYDLDADTIANFKAKNPVYQHRLPPEMPPYFPMNN